MRLCRLQGIPGCCFLRPDEQFPFAGLPNRETWANERTTDDRRTRLNLFP